MAQLIYETYEILYMRNQSIPAHVWWVIRGFNGA